MTLYGDFLADNHRRMHKWYQYFPVYERHFERFRNRHITLFEIGIGEGGSLQQWRRYFGPFAILVGIDIYPRCKQVEEHQVHVRIGSQADIGFLESVVAEFGTPDIVIDDGSHLQHHVNASFDFLYPRVAKNGVYVVEDLHAAYWPNHGGGVRAPGSFIETIKIYIDRMHAGYTNDQSLRSAAGERTTSIHVYDSITVFEVGERRTAAERLTGDPALFSGSWAPPGKTSEEFDQVVAAALQDMEIPEGSPRPPPDAPNPTAGAAPASRIAALEAELRLLRTSSSWRLTAPLRALRRQQAKILCFFLSRKRHLLS
jgi:hypothetical protein